MRLFQFVRRQLQFVTSGMPESAYPLSKVRYLFQPDSTTVYCCSSPNFLDEFKALSNMSLILEVNFILFT